MLCPGYDGCFSGAPELLIARHYRCLLVTPIFKTAIFCIHRHLTWGLPTRARVIIDEQQLRLPSQSSSCFVYLGVQCYLIPILTYGSECWILSPNMERKLEATEMWFHRRMLHISWKDHVTNDDVLRRARTERKLMNRIRAGQMSFLGHIMRKHGLEHIVVTGKIEGERSSRGRPRLNFMKSLSQLLKISEVEIIERTRNREEWRTMSANVRIGYGT